MEWAIDALDTLFFRGSDPFTAGDSVFLQSLFPPTPRTMQGMVRTALLEEHCVDLNLFARGGCDGCAAQGTCRAGPVVGTPWGIGTLQLFGPYLLLDSPNGPVRLYPAPGDLRVDKRGVPFRLEPGPAVCCDAGNVRLPQGPQAVDVGSDGDYDFDQKVAKRSRSYLGNSLGWLTERGLRSYLDGGLPAAAQIVGRDRLLVAEPRVGLARNATTRAADEGMLYSVELVRLRPGVRLGVRVAGADDDLLRTGLGLRRLGGEGRLVEVTECDAPLMPLPDAPTRDEIARTGRLRLLLLQPADFDGGWLPREFSPQHENGVTTWRGELQGLGMTIVASCGGEPVAIGGWRLADGQRADGRPTGAGPAALRRCVPAGTVYYCELQKPFDAGVVLDILDNAKVGLDTAIGFGHVVVGTWHED